MVLTEQVDALRAYGTDPIKRLIVSRVFAAFFIMLPLTFIADATGIIAGLFSAIREYANMITTSSIAAINTMGILGDKYVDISLGNLIDPVLNEGMLIKTATTLDVSGFVGSATGAIQEFQKTLTTINKIAELALNGSGVLGMLSPDQTTQHDLARVLYNLNRISTQLEQGNGNVGQLIQDTALFSFLKNTATNLDIITSRIQNGEGSLGKMVTDTTLYTRLNSIATLADSFLYNLETGNGTAGQLLHDRQLYEQLQVLIRSLIELTTDIKNNPKKYVTIKVF